MDNYFIRNEETRKLELHFARETYQALTDAQKSEIKSAFLWSRRASCWVSRAQFPNLWRAENIARSLNLDDAGKEGERLSYAEREELKSERAERRAERYETHAENAAARAESLQKPVTDMHGDIAFFTQPNVNTSAGRAFTRQRDRMFAAYDRGIEEYQKSAYWQERAAAARQTASADKLKSKPFCARRISEAEKDIRQIRRILKKGAELSVEQLERLTDMLEDALGKLRYYTDALDALGGVQFNRQNVHPGDIVRIDGFAHKVASTGPKYFYTEHCTYAYYYADIQEVISQA